MKKILTSMLIAGVILLAGCDGEDDGVNPGDDTFQGYLPSPSKEMYQGENSEVIADLKTNYFYDVYIAGYNDGPSDSISVYADNVEIGQYDTQAISMGGDGWYEVQYSPTFRFMPTNDIITFRVYIESADSYGTDPDWIYANRVIE